MPNKRRTRNRPKEEIEWIHNQKATNPSVQQRTLQAEFEKKFKKALPQASLSDILKKRHPEDSSVPGSSESTAHDTSREHVLQSSTNIDHATAVGPDSVAALDETTRFGAQRKHPALQPMSCAAGLQDIQYQELQIQRQLDPTRSASMHCPHPDTSNTPSPPWVLGLDLQDSMYRDQNGSSYDANIMNPPLPSAESAGSLRDDHGNRLISSVEVQDLALPDPEWWDPPLPSAESAGSLRDDHGNRLVSSVEVQDLAIPDPEWSDWFQNMCDQAEIPDNQPVDWNGIFNIVNPPAHMASIPAQGGVSMESSAGQLPETRPLQSAESPTQFPLKGLPGTSLKRKFTRNPSQPGLSFKRHRVQEGNTEDSGDILQSVDTLTSFFWTDEGMLESPAEAEAKEALKTIVEDINKRYQTTGKKDVKLIRDIRDHLMKSTGFMVRKGRKASAPVSSQPHSNRTFDSSQETAEIPRYRQENIVISYQSPCTRVDMVIRKRYKGICPNLNPPTDASEVALSGTKAKKGLKEGEGVYSKTDNRSTTYGGTLVLTPTNGQHQFALSICLPPKISFRTIIPSTSTVFKVAAFGTLDELKNILESRTESWNVCDENGASLINYAAAAPLNIPNCRYLLDLVEEVDTFEPHLILDHHDEWPFNCLFGGRGSMFGFSGIPIADIPLEEIGNRIEKHEMWCKMLLEKGADPSLLISDQNVLTNTNFLDAVVYSSTKTLEDFLNHGTPFISVNSDPDQVSPLVVLTDCFGLAVAGVYEAASKVDLLLKRGADVTARDDWGRTCLHLIVLSEQHQHRCIVTDVWLNWHCSCNKHYQRDAEHILIALIKAGADVCASDIDGLTVSETARSHGNLSLWVRALKICGYNYWKDQPPGVLSVRRTGNVNQQVTEVEDSDMEIDDGMDSDEGTDGDQDANSDRDMDSDKDMELEEAPNRYAHEYLAVGT